MANAESDKTLRKIADAFKELAATVNSQTVDMEVAPYSRACSFVSPLFGCLGIAFKFAEMDYVAKVDDLAEASKSIVTLNAILDRDIEGNCVRKAGSHTRNLLRVKRGLDMVRVFAPHHGWAIRKAVAAGMYALPTRAQLMKKLNEDEVSARIQMQSYITASGPVILYIDRLFLSRELASGPVYRVVIMQNYVLQHPIVLYIDRFFLSREMGIKDRELSWNLSVLYLLFSSSPEAYWLIVQVID
ncbi:hypothetical protein V6N13_020918 [Hibiscus sabdariffa]